MRFLCLVLVCCLPCAPIHAATYTTAPWGSAPVSVAPPKIDPYSGLVAAQNWSQTRDAPAEPPRILQPVLQVYLILMAIILAVRAAPSPRQTGDQAALAAADRSRTR